MKAAQTIAEAIGRAICCPLNIPQETALSSVKQRPKNS